MARRRSPSLLGRFFGLFFTSPEKARRQDRADARRAAAALRRERLAEAKRQAAYERRLRVAERAEARVRARLATREERERRQEERRAARLESQARKSHMTRATRTARTAHAAHATQSGERLEEQIQRLAGKGDSRTPGETRELEALIERFRRNPDPDVSWLLGHVERNPHPQIVRAFDVLHRHHREVIGTLNGIVYTRRGALGQETHYLHVSGDRGDGRAPSHVPDVLVAGDDGRPLIEGDIRWKPAEGGLIG